MATSLESDKELKSELFFATKCTRQEETRGHMEKVTSFILFFYKRSRAVAKYYPTLEEQLSKFYGVSEIV